MTRPGVVVTSRAEPPPRSAPTDAGVGFMVGATETGDDVKQVASLAQYEAEFGQRAGFVDAYDAAEAFFREGGALLYVSRSNGAPLALEARAITPAGEPVDPGAVPEGTANDVLAWVGDDPARAQAARSAEQSAESPRTSLVAKLDGIANVMPAAVDPGIASALARLTKSLGPGQIFAATGALDYVPDTHAALLAHASANNRVALLAADPAADAAALTTLAGGLMATPDARYGALFAPYAIVPGLTSGSTRTVPYAAIQAGIIARNDASLSPNVAAAGVNGQSAFAIDLSALFTDAERESLNDAGVDVARMVYDGVRTYGYRTLADLDTGWGLLSNARLNMEITAKADEVGERYVFAQIDGRRVRISQFGADLTAMLVPYYEAGSLFGDTFDDAAYVDVGPAVNTLESIADGVLRAVIGVRMSPFAELVVIEIVKVAVETPLSVAA